MMWGLLFVAVLLSCTSRHAEGFSTHPSAAIRRSSSALSAAKGKSDGRTKRLTTLGELEKKIMGNAKGESVAVKPKRARRTRRRAENPQQRYVYAAERQRMQANAEEVVEVPSSRPDWTAEARDLGLVNAANQHCDALVDENAVPKIMGQIRVGAESDSSAYAYIIDKPAGWSILGSVGGGKKKAEKKPSKESGNKNKAKKKRVKIVDDENKADFLEFDESDVLALLTPEERAELEAEGGVFPDQTKKTVRDDTYDYFGFYEIEHMTKEELEEAEIGPDDYDPNDVVEFDEADVFAAMTPEERLEMTNNIQDSNPKKTKKKKKDDNPRMKYLNVDHDAVPPETVENLKRIKSRLTEVSDSASFASLPRPSVVAWLKELKASEGVPIKGGKFWTALAGAVDVDDSGLVLICPKTNSNQVFVDTSEYVVVVGNGKDLTKPNKKPSLQIPKEIVTMSTYSKVKKGREDDSAQVVRLTIPEHMSTCADVIGHVQAQFGDGIRGDPAANPFDRRASRRLIHCRSLSVSSLSFDEDVVVETEELPDDISVLSNRLNNHKYDDGSFLGRTALRANPLTTAYREINGAADGFPGWTVDRYDQWLLVQHDPNEYRGPLPSIHDGNTAGVYYLSAIQDRGAMGSVVNKRPTLLEGRPAPDTFQVLENGVKYQVSLGRDLSTGIFLDQRPQRAWLTRNCNSQTRVLNCFAHCGAFSIAAATAGASTVSLDLEKKWLDRVGPQLEMNGIEFDERHDCIYGDCFDWLEKLAKRGEKFDILILDPPSSSVGNKKRRWSVKRDMDELVALAAPLVKKGGLLWTTTNSASMSSLKFAKACKRGLDNAGCQSAKLERIQPMPVDFQSIGPQPVKNLVWRMSQ